MRAIRPAMSPTTQWRHWCLALAGELPGEALRPKDSDRLLAELHGLGWTDAQIATHTSWSTYTVARMRDRLDLEAN